MILKDAEKAFAKIPHPFMILKIYQNGYKRKVIQHNKDHM